jgi:chromodomain-helicase-DNA-binding protein 4
LLKRTFFFLQIKNKIPVPDDITEQGVPAGHVPLLPDISELLRELPNLEPICK